MKQTPFKLGDRVAVYQGYNRCVGTITAVCGEMVQIGIGKSEFHWRQCSKLIKKPRKTIWVNEYTSGMNAHSTEQEAKSNAQKIAVRIAVPYREVRFKK